MKTPLPYYRREENAIIGSLVSLIGLTGQGLGIYGIYDWLTSPIGSGLELLAIAPLAYVSGCFTLALGFRIIAGVGQK